MSHGLVRLSVKNAATLWALVKREKMANTSVVVTGDIADAEPLTAARPRPKLAKANGHHHPAPAPLDPLFLNDGE